ncbi:MAG: hypothetical protein WDW38_001670 [Sanguina aurantia]
MLRWLVGAVCGVGALASFGLTVLYFFQEKILYVPQLPGIPSNYWVTPDNYKLAYEDLEVTSGDGVKLHAWLLKDPTWHPDWISKRPIVMFFQENAGNMAHRLPFLRLLVQQLQCPVFAPSYRGYGLSKGQPNERGLKLDAQAALDHILARTDFKQPRVLVFGRSLGGAVAIHLTANNQDKVAALIVENSFTSVEAMVGQMFSVLGHIIGPGRPLNFLVTNKWRSIEDIRKITTVPLLMMVSMQDEMVPASQMLELHAAQRAASCTLLRMESAGHMDAYSSEARTYWPALRKLYTEILERR